MEHIGTTTKPRHCESSPSEIQASVKLPEWDYSLSTWANVAARFTAQAQAEMDRAST